MAYALDNAAPGFGSSLLQPVGRPVNRRIVTSGAPGNQRADPDRYDQANAEFVDDVVGRSGVPRERSQDGLDKQIVASMENGRGPEAVRAQGQPRHDVRVGHDHQGETDQAIPRRSPLVVIAEEQDWEMVGGPHQSADQPDAAEADDFVQLRDEKAAPADFFAEGPRCFADQTNRGGEQ